MECINVTNLRRKSGQMGHPESVVGTPFQSGYFYNSIVLGPFVGLTAQRGRTKGSLYRKTHSQVWNRGEQGDISGHWWCLQRPGPGGATPVEPGVDSGFHGTLGGDAGSLFLLVRGRAWLRVDGCGLLPGTPCGGIDLRGGRRGDFFSKETRDGRG